MKWASQERTHLNPVLVEDSGHALILVKWGYTLILCQDSEEDSGHTSILVRRGYTSIPCQKRTVDTPVKKGYTSILCQERTVDTSILVWRGYVVIHLDSISGEDTPQSCVCMGENISIPDFSNSSSVKMLWRWAKKTATNLNCNCEKQKGASRMEMSTITLKAR
jgi:hypothetical protein